LKLGLIQLTSELDYKNNIKKIRHFLNIAKNDGAEYVFLPECFYSMSDGLKPSPHLIEENNDHFENIRSLATDFSIYILGGSAAALVGDKVVNRNFNFSPSGEDLGHYDKIHLFSCDLQKEKANPKSNTKQEKKVIDESDIYSPGNEEKIIFANELKIGASICFDLRYPGMFRRYAENGVNLLSISAAFTVPTGRAHWHTLLKARAIENQCFVVAPAQYGRHNNRITTYGHSLIIDPWGIILADAKEGEKYISAEIDLKRIDEVRRAVKIF